MSDLNQQLKEYLLRSEKNEHKGGIADKLKEQSFRSWFGGGTPDHHHHHIKNASQTVPADCEEENGWFTDAAKDPLLPSLGKKQRLVGFVGCVAMGFFCFTLASFYAPFLLVKARKFALLYTLGSLFIIGSFSLLWGPVNHMKHLFSRERLGFTAAYFGTLFATLYCALVLKNTILTAVCAILQIVALIWYVVSYIPGGQTGLRFFTKIFTGAITKAASKTLPV